MNQHSQLSMLEMAVQILKEKNDKILISELLDEVISAHFGDLSAEELIEHKTRLYTDIVSSSKFVFVTKNEIDLKENNILKEYDKDGSEFYDKSELVESEEENNHNLSCFGDEDITPEDEEEEVDYDMAGHEVRISNDEEFDEKDSYDDGEEDDLSDDYDDYDDYDEFDSVSDDLLDSAEEFDEDKYNEYMDEYEDQYED